MSGPANGAAVASKFVFLHEIPSLTQGTKVRVLGCIVEYDVANGRLLLEHAYPRTTSPIPSVWVDIALVLETTKPETLISGTWINVIAYAQSSVTQARQKSAKASQGPRNTVTLQAILIWDAGAIRIGDYEHMLEEQKRLMR